MNYKVQRTDQDKRFYKSVSMEHGNMCFVLFLMILFNSSIEDSTVNLELFTRVLFSLLHVKLPVQGFLDSRHKQTIIDLYHSIKDISSNTQILK